MNGLIEIREIALVDMKEVVEQNQALIEDAYERVMKLAHIARREGLLAIEYEAEFMCREIPLCDQITEMIAMIVDGMEPHIFEELVTIKFFAVYQYTGIDALLYFLYARSMLMIQAGMPPWVIEQLFNAVIPCDTMAFEEERVAKKEQKRCMVSDRKEKMTKEERVLLNSMSGQLQSLSEKEWKIVVSSDGFYGFNKLLPLLEEDVRATVHKYMNDYRYYVIMNDAGTVTKTEMEELNGELAKLINKMRDNEEQKCVLDAIQKCSDEELQLLLRHIDHRILETALKGAKEEVTECFYRNLSSRLRCFILEDMEYMGPVKMSDIEDAKQQVIKVARHVLDWEAVERR